MRRSYVLPRSLRRVTPAALRAPAQAPPLKVSDPSARAMLDFERDPLLAVGEDAALEHVLDQMFRHGTRAFLVVRDQHMVGLITSEHARAEPAARRVAEVMLPAASVPAVPWQMVSEASVGDLLALFERHEASHLLVLQERSPALPSVRGLFHRERLERQLGPRWAAHPPAARPGERPGEGPGL